MNKKIKIDDYLSDRKKLVESTLKHYMPKPSGLAGDVVSAMNYTVFAGGKRLRPILCIGGAESVGGAANDVLPVACAIELIHSYSLIHDDLPSMDNDDFRRGRPTNHKVFGEATALLAGDGLLTMAFDLMAESGDKIQGGQKKTMRAIKLIASAAGYKGMVGGQSVDIKYEEREADPETVEFIHRHKTGVLIAASVVSGAILAGGNEAQVDSINTYGRQIGLAFQITDDILNIEGERHFMGKGTGSDQAKGKVTYPSVFGLKESKAISRNLVEDAIESINGLDKKADPLRELARYIVFRNL